MSRDMNAIVTAFHRVATLSREEVFGPHDDRPISDPDNVGTAAPGWVGEDWSGDLLLVGNFPGGGGDRYAGNPTDAELYAAFRAFRDSIEGTPRVAAFERMSRVYREAEQSHALWRTVIRAVLGAAGVPEARAAFINLVPFRTRENRPPAAAARRRAWTLGVRAQVEALSPHRIVALGVATGKALASLNPPELHYEVIPRAIGDTRLPAEAEPVLQRLRAGRA